ncbi:pyridoxal 5'-phosphate synthase [Georgenia sp. SYP-B2076]|uniref:pyridoxine/pyridoxamine 5'-phosphate oxidase n=1 Tax=Georgenia sp. SYP-B2076 TaxID=2495881 RepID=UPI000F8C638B|nr:pyridoxamine 5'-phosphate oxidase family protein [Georgenia sp. SYP-B2076]
MAPARPAAAPVVNRFGGDVDVDDTPADPMALARLWVGDLVGEERPLMTLSTIDADGFPDSRHVMLSDVAEVFCFYTDARSRKAAELVACPRVALAVVWRGELRQLVVQGSVSPADDEAAAGAFGAQSRYLQLLAWHNDDALAARPAELRRRSWARFDAAHPEGTLAPPPWWRGYRVTPHRLVFWRGDAQGPSNRLGYARSAEGVWVTERLAG